MDIEIDQSGKIEDTNKNTVVAFSNSRFKSVLIGAKEKREVQKLFRRIGRSRMFVYRSFAILIFLLIRRHLKEIQKITIDEEYPGKESLIKNLLFQEIRAVNADFDKKNIVFRRIGKKSRAHFVAYGVAAGKKTADL